MSKFCVMFKSSRWEDIEIEANGCTLSNTGDFVIFENEYGGIVGIFCADLIAGIYQVPEEIELKI